jgi:hypothetical protein
MGGLVWVCKTGGRKEGRGRRNESSLSVSKRKGKTRFDEVDEDHLKQNTPSLSLSPPDFFWFRFSSSHFEERGSSMFLFRTWFVHKCGCSVWCGLRYVSEFDSAYQSDKDVSS